MREQRRQRVIEVLPVTGKIGVEDKNIIPWHLRTMAKFEKWYLKNLYHVNPECERIVRFYTVSNKNTIDYKFKCPNYAYDLYSTLYDDFIETCCTVGKQLMDMFEVTGEYYYDVKITLCYFNGNTEMTSSWKILKTDNPRCIAGCPTDRKNCEYLKNSNSKLEIQGYKLSGKYKRFVDVLSDLSSKTIVVHNKMDAKVFLRVVKFLGVDTVDFNGRPYRNLPTKTNFFNRRMFGYQLVMTPERTVIACVVNKSLMPTNCEELLDIDEFVVKRTFRAKLRDFIE